MMQLIIQYQAYSGHGKLNRYIETFNLGYNKKKVSHRSTLYYSASNHAEDGDQNKMCRGLNKSSTAPYTHGHRQRGHASSRAWYCTAFLIGHCGTAHVQYNFRFRFHFRVHVCVSQHPCFSTYSNLILCCPHQRRI